MGICPLAGAPVSMQPVAEPNRSALVRGATGGAVYAVLGLIQRGLPLLLLPLYANALSPNEYGQVALILAATAIVGAVLGFGLEAAVLRTAIALAGEPEKRYRFVNTVGLFAIVVPLVGSILAGLTAAGLVGASLPVPVEALFVGLLAAAVQTSVTVFVGALLRADERLRDYSIVTAAYAVTSVIGIILLVVVVRIGPLGWVVANLAASIASLVIGLLMLGHRWSRVFASDQLRMALLFGIPLLPHTISHWVLNVSDRLVLGASVSAADVGVYNLAYQLAAGAALLVIAAHQGVMPMYAEASTETAVRKDLGRIATYQVHFTILIGLAVVLLGPPMIAVAFPASYAGAASLIPWIAVGYVFFGLYLIPMDSLSVMVGRTRWLWIPTALAASVNVALNLWLVPRFGAAAAAVDTAIAYGALLLGVMVLRVVGEGPRVPYASGAMATGIAIGVGAGAAAIWVVPHAHDLASLAERGVFVLAAAIAIVLIEFGRSSRKTEPGDARGNGSEDQDAEASGPNAQVVPVARG
jgi:O-antigen/teichoic acid export membrane protein